MRFIILSEEDTLHAEYMNMNSEIAGTIVLETKLIGKIQGIQFAGEITKLEGTHYRKARLAYLKRFPYAATSNAPLWEIALRYIKMTDNRFGFGKKIIWQR